MTASVKDNGVRADFFLTMARAFAPPIGQAMQRGFVESLPDDLSEMQPHSDIRWKPR
jgi:hypothetical protein